MEHSSPLDSSGLLVERVQVENSINPLGIENPTPVLSWKLKSEVNSERQSAYRIVVASSAAALGDPTSADVWDSGKVDLSDSVGIVYAGKPLESQHRYHWKVQAWDARGVASAWSDAAWWEMGLLSANDWHGAQWITPERDSSSSPMLRKDFSLGKPVADARVYVHGLGLYELHLNGHKVGDHVLTPANTPYATRNVYDSYDVTDALIQGSNAVGLWLGNGYDQSFSAYGFRWLGPKQAIMLIDVRYADGTHDTVTTDDSWRFSHSPITANGIYAGESYDARLEQSGWDTAGFDDDAWAAVQTVPAPEGALVADAMPRVRVTSTLEPAAMTEPKPGVYVYDLGQNIAGWARIRAEGPRGTTVTMRTAEEIDGVGMLDSSTNRGAASTDRFTLAGTGGLESYEPRFTYHGFRYVEVTGFPGTPTLGSLAGTAVHADVASIAHFTSSDGLLNQIWQNNRCAILNNSMSTPTDTPVRDERTPPGMDVQAYRDASTREFDMHRFYANYLLDMPAGTALPSDAVKCQYPDMAGDGVSLPWTLYEQYGDAATLAIHYPLMKQFVDTNAADHPDLIWPHDLGFGDWCPPDRGPNANGGMGNPYAGDCTSEVSIVNTALWYLQASDVAKAADVLGYPDDVAHYEQLAAEVNEAFNAAFLNDAGDTYGDGRQVTSILPLAFEMVPDGNVQAVGRRLVRTILEDDNGHLDTGIFGTRYLMDALAKIGRIDVAMTVLAQTSYPGFGFEIGTGATTPWEQWAYKSAMETHDHAMFAGINASFYTQLAGIRPAGGGYRSIVIDPQVPADLDHVSASIDTGYGPVASSWKKTGNEFALEVIVPVNSTATVHVPLLGFAHSSATRGAQLAFAAADKAVYTVGSGVWNFSASTVEARMTSSG